jgi:hypothetical protein
MKITLLSFAFIFSLTLTVNQSVAQEIPYEGDTCFALLGRPETSAVMQHFIGYLKQDSKFVEGNNSGKEWYEAPSLGMRVIKPVEEKNYNTFRYYSGVDKVFDRYKGELPLGLTFDMPKKQLSKTIKKHKYFKRVMLEKKFSESYEILYRSHKYTLTLRYKLSDDKVLEFVSIYRKKQ